MQDTTAATIIRHLESLGYAVSIHRINDTIEMHAVPLKDPDNFQIVRCNDGNGPEEELRAACLLAEAVGIDLEE